MAKLQFGVIKMELMSILNVLAVASTLTNVLAGKIFLILYHIYLITVCVSNIHLYDTGKKVKTKSLFKTIANAA